MRTKSREQLLREKRKFWKAHLHAWQNSGYSLADYSKHHNLIYHRLIYWKTKFENEQTKPLSFVPVPLQTEPDNTPLTLNLQNDRFRIEIGSGFSDTTLRKLLTTLETL
jgi:hypothetical protein